MECPKLADLSKGQLEEIHRVEENLGLILIAYERVRPLKELSSEDLSKIKSLEKETGSVLIAYES